MAKRQFFGIKYPFTSNDFQKYIIDVNLTEKDKVRSQIMHVIFTPKGQRLRMPDFGTDLIRYIFESNSSQSWEGVKNEISDAVVKYVPNAMLDNIQVVQSEDNPNSILVRIDYKINKGNQEIIDSIVTEI